MPPEAIVAPHRIHEGVIAHSIYEYRDRTMRESTYVQRVWISHLPAGAPNILIL